METVANRKLYESMFLVDSARAGADWDGVIATIETVLKKAEAEIVSIRKWDDRRLAYKVNNKTRGTYILCYFRADGEKIRDIEKDVQLSEQIMRVLILSAEKWTTEDIEKETPAMKVGKEKEKHKAAQEAAEKVETEQQSAQEQPEETAESEESEPSTEVEASTVNQPQQPEVKDSEPAGDKDQL